jgi:hypothetical protein
MPTDIELVVVAQQTSEGSYLGLIAGFLGIIYGLTSEKFSRYGGFSGRKREYFVPTQGLRIFVVSVSAAVMVISFWYLVSRR